MKIRIFAVGVVFSLLCTAVQADEPKSKNKASDYSQEYEVSVRLKKSAKQPDKKGGKKGKKKEQPITLILEGEVKVGNSRSSSLSTAPATVQYALLGRSVAKSGLSYVFDVRESKIKSLESGEEKEIKIRTYKTTYLDDKKKSYGAKYSGYAVLIKNAAGEVIGGKSVPSNLFEKNKDQLKGLKKDAFYDRDWQRVSFKDKHPKNKKK